MDTPVKVEQLLPVNMHHLIWQLQDKFMCYDGTHKLKLVQCTDTCIISQCKCGKQFDIAGYTNISYNNSQNIILFAAKTKWFMFFENIKQLCEYVSKCKIVDDYFVLSCSHHKTCPVTKVKIMGSLNLTHE